MTEITVDRIRAIEVGSIIRSMRKFIDDDDVENEIVELPVYSFLLDTSIGYVLIDTGFNSDILNNDLKEADKRGLGKFGPEFHIAERLGNVGIDVKDIVMVILTHLHYDHSGGLNAFLHTDAKFLAQRQELENALISIWCYGSNIYRKRDIPSTQKWIPITTETFDLGSSIKIRKVGSHTKGSQVVRVRTMKGKEYEIIGDLVHLEEEYVSERTGTSQLTNDFSSWRDEVRRLKFTYEQLGVKKLFSHDRTIMENNKTIFE